MKTTHERLAAMESCIKEVIPRLERRLDSIDAKLDNHIAYISNKVDVIEATLNKRPSWLITFIISLLLFCIGLLADKFI